MMVRNAVVLVAIASVVAPDDARGQCFVMVDSTGGVARQVDVGRGFVRWFQSDGIWAHCRGEDTRWQSDSAAWYQDFNRFDMVGEVDFRDASVHLTADRASYFTRDERLEAYGNARLVNLRTGSVLRGPNLTYRRSMPGVRDTTEWFASGRPTIEYRSADDSAGAEPYIIIADRVSMRGESAAYAWGRVTIDRSDFAAEADSATLDTDVGAGTLVGHARIAGGDSSGYTLAGRVIEYRLTGRKPSWVQAEGLANATSDEWRILGDTIQFDLVNDRVERGNAWGDSTRPRAVSISHSITADSLAIYAPGQHLSEMWGFGSARATSRVDSMDTETDWLAGDTVVARFDTTAVGRTTLSWLEAHGSAQARYRIYPADAPAGMPDISYSRGARILVRFEADQVKRVHVAGQTDGVYLQAPRGRRQ